MKQNHPKHLGETSPDKKMWDFPASHVSRLGVTIGTVITIIPTPELRFLIWEGPLQSPPFGMTKRR